MFYPEGLPHARELEYASRCFGAIEINGTFYGLQRPESYAAWYDAAPRGFRFAVKGSRFITHMKQLNDVRVPLANFFASGVLRLEDKLGPILWQFPPRMRYDAARFERFLRLLPRSSLAAARLARQHDRRVSGRSWLRVSADRPLQHAVEVRHESFFTAAFVRQLRAHGAGFVLSESAGQWPLGEDVTAGFVYLRLHGAEELYASGYDDPALDRWATRIEVWASGREPPDAARATAPAPQRCARDVYVFFDNDSKVRAPFDAIRLMERLRVRRPGLAVAGGSVPAGTAQVRCGSGR